MRYDDVKFSVLTGKTLTAIERVAETDISGAEAIIFTCADGTRYAMTHYQDCCEEVSIEDIDGDLDRLIGGEILLAEETSNGSGPDTERNERGDDSYTWTFYKLATNKDSVTIRWYGASNGYYSEEVELYEILD